MSEGNGVSLYVLVGAIIFSLFVTIAVVSGDKTNAMVGNIMGQVTGFVEGDEVKSSMQYDGQSDYKNRVRHNSIDEFYNNKKINPYFAAAAATHVLVDGKDSGYEKAYIRYATYDKDGNVDKVYSYGDPKNYDYVIISDQSLLPREYAEKGYVSYVDESGAESYGGIYAPDGVDEGDWGYKPYFQFNDDIAQVVYEASYSNRTPDKYRQ